jgi:hypothetical protein
VNLDGFALPVKELKGTDPVEMLDLSGKNLGVASAVVIASLIGVNGALTVTNLLRNRLDAESAKMLAEVAKQKGISLCGIQRDQTTADFRYQDLKPPDAILLVSDLTQAVVTGGLTTLDLSSNQLCGLDRYGRGTYTAEGITAIADSLRVNGALTSLDLSNNALCGLVQGGFSVIGTYTAEGITAIADALRVNGGLTSIDLSENLLGEEGTKVICEALEQNMTLKELDIRGREPWSNIGGTAGVKHVAKMLGVNGGLTALDLSSNSLKDEGVSAVCKAIQTNKETKLASLNFKNNGIGPGGANAVAAMVAVTGALTSVELRGNKLGNKGWGAIFAAICGNKDSKIVSMDASCENISHAGIQLIAEALRTSLTGALTVTNLLSNKLDAGPANEELSKEEARIRLRRIASD